MPSSRSRFASLVVLTLTLVLVGPVARAQTDPATVARSVSGLVVHVGCGDARLTLSLTDRDRRIVQGLCPPAQLAAARATVAASPDHRGFVSVRALPSFQTLPYVSNLADLVIADLDALGAAAPAPAELERIAAPGGMILTKKGAWTTRTKPRPEGIDDWRQQWHGADGNPLSRDTRVAPAFHLQWLTGYHLASTSLFAVSGDTYVSIRAPGGFPRTTKRPPNAPAVLIEARSAWSGSLRWQRGLAQKAFNDLHTPLLLDDKRIYTLENDTLVALDLATGNETARFAEAGTFAPKPGQRTMMAVIEGPNLIVSNGNGLFAFDTTSARLKWSQTSTRFWSLPRIGGGKVFALESESPVAAGTGDHGWVGVTKTTAVAAFDLASGKPLWRHENPDTAGFGVANLIYHAKHGLAIQGFGRSVFRVGTFVRRLDPATGKVLSDFADPNDERTPDRTFLRSMRTLILDDQGAFVMRGRNITGFDPATNQKFWAADSEGTWSACYGSTMTPRWVFNGHIWFDRERPEDNFVAATHSQTRCTIPPIPANGMVYFREGSLCLCVSTVRGARALTPEPPGPALPDTARLATGPALGRKVAPLEAPPAEVDPHLWESDPKLTQRFEAVYDQRREFLIVEGPLAPRDWTGTDVFSAGSNITVQAGDVTLTADTHRHTISASKAGRTLWTHLASARISRAPTVHQGWVLFGSHDGKVTCLDAATGDLAWQWTAAHNDRQGLFHGQLESLWPVYGAVAHEGKVYASAGRHPLIDHGIFVDCLDLATGKPVWRKRAARDPVWGKPSGKELSRKALLPMNHMPAIVDGKLKIAALRYDLATGEMHDPFNVHTSGPIPASDAR